MYSCTYDKVQFISWHYGFFDHTLPLVRMCFQFISFVCIFNYFSINVPLIGHMHELDCGFILHLEFGTFH